MHQNSPLLPLDKCIILLSYINERNPTLFMDIIQTLSSHNSEIILNRLKEKPLYNKEEVRSVLEEYNDIVVDHTQVFPNESFKTQIQSNLSADSHQLNTGDISHSFLGRLSIDSILTLINVEPVFFTGLLCHMLPRNEFAKLLLHIPEDTAKDGFSYYTKIMPANSTLLIELTDYYFENLSQIDQKKESTPDKRSKDIAQIVELLPNSNNAIINSIVPSDIRDLVEESLLSIDDLARYSPKDQQVILSSFESSETLAKILSLLPEELCSTLINTCLTSRQMEIVSEELEIIKNIPLSEDNKTHFANQLIQQIRTLERNQKINELSSELPTSNLFKSEDPDKNAA